MSSGKKARTSVDSGNPVPIQNHSPEQPFYSLDTFYNTLLSRTFNSSTEAIAFCRDLCSSHGFTVKQEQSTHKNIYVYCSREGLPDSHRNPKVNPQRNRQSQRCECRWRIVLFENLKLTWDFRKSQNTDAFIHNHPLLRPGEIKKEWPREVSEKIFELARQRLPTNEIRQQVREHYPDISWDDRRFYNRLSEERQKMKQRDTANRTIRLVNLSAQICMVNAGSEDLSHYVESKLLSLLEDTCKFANISPHSIAMPIPAPPFASPNPEEKLPVTPNSQHSFSIQYDEDVSQRQKRSSLNKLEIKREMDNSNNNLAGSSSSSKTSPNPLKPDDNTHDASETKSRPSSLSSIHLKQSFDSSLPKGYIAVPIPEHTFHVKMYSQNSAGDIRRAIFDMQRPTIVNASLPTNPNMIHSNPHLQYVVQNREPRRTRSRALFAPDEDSDSMDLDTPARKLSRQIASSIMDDEQDDLSSQSSPSNSQSLLFAAANTPTHTQEMNANADHHHQLIGTGSGPAYNRIPSGTSTPTTVAGTSAGSNLFYGAGSSNTNPEASGSNSNNLDSHTYLNQSSFPTPTPNTNIYPSMNTNPNVTNRHVQQQHVMYDANPYVQQQQQTSNHDLGLMQQHHHTMNRPHSMTFGATIPPSMRAQSVSLPRGSSTDNVRPAGYPSSLAQLQLQSMMEDNDGKRYYSTYRDANYPQQPQQPSSPIPPRAAATAGASSSHMMSQPYLSHPNTSDGSQHLFSPYQASSHQQVFTMPYMTSEQMLQEQQKRKQQLYNINYQQQQQHFERQQQEKQQHLYRRASGPG